MAAIGDYKNKRKFILVFAFALALLAFSCKKAEHIPPAPSISFSISPSGDSAEITIAGEDGADIRYTLDGSVPDGLSLLYSDAFALQKNAVVSAVCVAGSKVGPVATVSISSLKAQKPVVRKDADGLIHVESATEGSVVYVSEGTDSVPTTASAKYTEPFPSSENIVRAFAVKDGIIDSDTEAYFNSTLAADYGEELLSAESQVAFDVIASDSEGISGFETGVFYTFDGSDPNEGGGLKSEDGIIVVTKACDLKARSAVKLNGVWVYGELAAIKFHQVLFQFLDDSKGVDPKIVKDGTQLTPFPDALSKSKTGYTLPDAKWIDAAGNEYAEGFEVVDSITLTPLWVPNNYKVRFNAGSDGVGSMADQDFVYDAAANLTANLFLNDIYDFSGWALLDTSQDVVYGDCANVKNLTAEKNGVVDLYAIFHNEKSSLLSYDVASAENGHVLLSFSPHDAGTYSSLKIYYTTDSSSPVTSGSRIEYSGPIEIDGEKRVRAAAEVVRAGKLSTGKDVELNFYKVTFDFNNGGDDVVSEIMLKDSEVTLPDATVEAHSKTGYHFVKWKFADGAELPSGVLRVTSSMTLKAARDANNYSVVFDPGMNGTSGGMNAQDFKYDQSKSLSALGFSKVGWDFLGWADEKGSDTVKYSAGQTVQNLTAGNGAEVRLYGVWEHDVDVISESGYGTPVSLSGNGKIKVDAGAGSDVFFVYTNPTGGSASVSASVAKSVLASMTPKEPDARQNALFAVQNKSSLRSNDAIVSFDPPDSKGPRKREFRMEDPDLSLLRKSSFPQILRNELGNEPNVGDEKLIYDKNRPLQTHLRHKRKVGVNVGGVSKEKTLLIYVADDVWGGNGCKITEDDLVVIADLFLKSGANNDVYDYVTAIFGEEWGPHTYSNLIASNDRILFFVCDIDGDTNYGSGGVYTYGYFWGLHNYKKADDSRSAEGVMLTFDAYRMKDDLSTMLSTLGHEFQHAVHFYQHAIKPMNVNSDSFFNEMFSAVTEDLLAAKLTELSGKKMAGPSAVDIDANVPVDGLRGTLSGQNIGYGSRRSGRIPWAIDAAFDDMTDWKGTQYSYGQVYALGSYVARNYPARVFLDYMSGADGPNGFIAAIRKNDSRFSGKSDKEVWSAVLGEWAAASLLSSGVVSAAPFKYNNNGFFTADSSFCNLKMPSVNFADYYSRDFQDSIDMEAMLAELFFGFNFDAYRAQRYAEELPKEKNKGLEYKLGQNSPNGNSVSMQTYSNVIYRMNAIGQKASGENAYSVKTDDIGTKADLRVVLRHS